MKPERRNILIVDDDEQILFAFQEMFRKEGYASAVARDGEAAIRAIEGSPPDVLIMDITMPRLDGLETLRRIREKSPQIPVVMITGFGTMQTAIRAMQLGAFEYLTKPLDVARIRDVVRRALAGREGEALGREQVSFQSHVVNRYDIIGATPRMLEVYKLIGSISVTPNMTPVLILGESGTGKELAARAIHAHSGHAADPFIPINCTALPEALLESELFGYEKGAFTGAFDRKLGKFDMAGKGTIFLDEIGTLSLHLQQKLLRVIQEREFERIGGNEPRNIEARFVAATNQDLESEVRRKTFREDLFFRLNVATLRLPPLRERRDDIPLLAGYFLTKYNEQLKKQIRGFSQEALDFLRAYPYPGTVRELENLIERAVMLTQGEIILRDAFGEQARPLAESAAPLPLASPVFSIARARLLESFEKQFIIETLSASGGNVTLAARRANMTRQNFQRLMKKHRVESTSFRR